jgi:DsbC/DsbD-like thiol-disulfide interchange protein
VFLDSVKKATLIRSFETIPCMSDFGNHLRGRFLANRKRMTPSLNRAQAEQREQRAEAEQREREAAERRQAEADEVARRALEAGQSQGRLTPWGAPGGPHA